MCSVVQLVLLNCYVSIVMTCVYWLCLLAYVLVTLIAYVYCHIGPVYWHVCVYWHVFIGLCLLDCFSIVINKNKWK